ncbi:YqaE/Pmp3 family membrane protein [uncultured Sphingomonas sp.]|uniref:YqaE/Pmp3 family membrane protein n=1 Tax=uncultured Sphingomonas sp. TaxID=158754 RepID=UPI0025CD2F7C|nr:YqaE/Pmp3 family membrane protein [uncultured Sphingomonas sp.]
MAAVLLPPLGVFLKHGTGRDFWIACALTLIGFLPGVVFSLWIVLRKARDEAPATV